MPLTYPQAIQAIPALEVRRAEYERKLAAGLATVDDAEMVIRECSRAIDAIRGEFDIPEFASIAALHDEVFGDRRTERMLDAAWELHKAEFDRMQAADPEAPVWGGIEQYQAEGR